MRRTAGSSTKRAAIVPTARARSAVPSRRTLRMLCRRVSFSGSSPRTGRSRSSSIRRSWRSGNRFRPPAENHSRYRRAVPASSRRGSRVSRPCRTSLFVCSLVLALAVCAGTSLAAPAPPSGVPPGQPSPAPSSQPSPPPAAQPTPAPPSDEQKAQPPQEPDQDQGQTAPAPGGEAAPPAGKPEGEEGPSPAQPSGGKGVIGRIVVDGNVRVSDRAFFSNLKLKSGDPYDERAIQDEFRRLWDQNLFDDIIVESRRRGGDVYDLVFHVRDRPLGGNVAFVGVKAGTSAHIQG